MKQFMLAGVSSGVGKTTVTLGILKALADRGYQVQPYKVGPDLIILIQLIIVGLPSVRRGMWTAL